MTDIAALIADMVRAGVDPDLIGRTASALAEHEPVVVTKVDEVAERKRAADRERMRVSRDIARQSRDAATPSPLKVSPHTPLPKTPNPIPPSPPKGGSSPVPPDGWAEFWAIYPHKVGKPDALKAYGRAIKRADPGVILDGLKGYAAKTDDRPWCNPATWLNQDRWGDQPAEVAARQRAGPAQAPPSQADVFRMVGQRFTDERQEREDSSGFRAAIPHLRPAGAG